jgi:hypothetical protein
MRKFLLPLLIAAFMSVSAAAQSKIEGVWQLTEITVTGEHGFTMKVTQPSVYTFTKKYYSKIYVATDKPRPVLDDYSKATREQLSSIFVEGFDANAGTYEVKAGKLTTHPIVARSPSDMSEGTWATYLIKMSGNTISLTPEASNTGPAKKPLTFKLTRVE